MFTNPMNIIKATYAVIGVAEMAAGAAMIAYAKKREKAEEKVEKEEYTYDIINLETKEVICTIKKGA